jgi:hypothetical protein
MSMAQDGERVPMVFWARYTVLTAPSGGTTTYYTTPVDLLGFTDISVTCFRSKIIGGGAPTTDWTFEQSSDLVDWADLGSSFDPSGGTNVAGEAQQQNIISRRYVRLRIDITNAAADATMTLFAVGWGSRSVS